MVGEFVGGISTTLVEERIEVTVGEVKRGGVSPGVKVSAVEATLSLTVSAFIFVTIREVPSFCHFSLRRIVLIPSLPFRT